MSTHEPLPEAGGSAQKRAEQIVQTLVLAVLFAAPALMCAHAACVTDPDIWWHLRTGEWILAHHAVPQADPSPARWRGGRGWPIAGCMSWWR